MKKRVLLNVLLLLVLVSPLFGKTTEKWIISYGTDVSFSDDYLTGFGMQMIQSSKSESLESAKLQAMNDLSKKVRVQISSSITELVKEVGDSASNSFSMVNKSTSELQLSQAQYLIETVNGIIYTLAYVKKNVLVNDFNDIMSKDLKQILLTVKESDALIKKDLQVKAAEELIKVLPLFAEVYSNRSLISAIDKRELAGLYMDLNGILELEHLVKSKIDNIKKFKNSTLDDALLKVAFILKEQGISGIKILNPAFTYQQTDFSSPFGQYVSAKLALLLKNDVSSGNKELVVQGSYWVKDDKIELLVNAVLPSEMGKVVGSASVTFPKEKVPTGYDIQPQNHNQALLDLQEFVAGALTDGGIMVDFWTNKGKNEDVLVYHEGEELKLFLRVNQPCTIQITYILSTGEKVLLEESFYIGMDKVNMVVEYPYSFEVIPPFGVERLIVTAFSDKPPTPNVMPVNIDGETYMVFNSVKDVVAQTRGLARVKKSSVKRTGEAQVALTTILQY